MPWWSLRAQGGGAPHAREGVLVEGVELLDLDALGLLRLFDDRRGLRRRVRCLCLGLGLLQEAADFFRLRIRLHRSSLLVV